MAHQTAQHEVDERTRTQNARAVEADGRALAADARDVAATKREADFCASHKHDPHANCAMCQLPPDIQRSIGRWAVGMVAAFTAWALAATVTWTITATQAVAMRESQARIEKRLDMVPITLPRAGWTPTNGCTTVALPATARN